MAQNKGFADWLANLTAASVQAGDQIPFVHGGVSKRAAAGQAGGLASLDASGVVVQTTAILQITTADTATTKKKVSENEIASFTAKTTGPVVVIASGDWTRSSGSPRGAYEIYHDGTLILRSSVLTDQTTAISGVVVVAFTATKGKTISVRAGVWPGQEDGTKELKIWTQRVQLLEFGAA